MPRQYARRSTPFASRAPVSCHVAVEDATVVNLGYGDLDLYRVRSTLTIAAPSATVLRSLIASFFEDERFEVETYSQFAPWDCQLYMRWPDCPPFNTATVKLLAIGRHRWSIMNELVRHFDEFLRGHFQYRMFYPYWGQEDVVSAHFEVDFDVGPLFTGSFLAHVHENPLP